MRSDMVAGTAVMGKAGRARGDSLDGFERRPAETTISQAFLRDPHARSAARSLQTATTRTVYDCSTFTSHPQRASVSTAGD